jgi:hypothetical protein
MAAFFIKSFGGVSPKTPPRYLQDSQAQTAINCPVFAGTLVPLPGLTTNPVVNLTNIGAEIKTIYRYGQDDDSDFLYWFAWDRDVDVARGQIAGDPVEWTFFTGDGYPKATYNKLATSAAPYPSDYIPLGVPNPSEKLDATPDPAFNNTEQFAAEVILDVVALQNLTTSGCEISLDDGTTYTSIPLNVPYTPPGGTTIPTLPTNNRAAYVAGRITTVATATPLAITAVVDKLNVVIKTTATGNNVSIIFRGITGTTENYDTTGDFTYNALNETNTASGLQQPIYFLKADQWGAIATDLPAGKSTKLVIRATQPASSEQIVLVNKTRTTPFADANAVATFITSNWVNAARTLSVDVYGSTVVLRPNNTNYGKTIGGTNGWSGTIRIEVDKYDDAEKLLTKEFRGNVNSPAYSYVLLTTTQFDTSLKGKFVAVTVNGTETIFPIAKTQNLFFFLPQGVESESIATDDSAIIIKTLARTGSSLTVRGGEYPKTTVNAYSTLSNVGYENEKSVAETRVYTYTWVSTVAKREFESGPAAPSLAVDVFDGQSVRLSKFQEATLTGSDYIVDKIYKVTTRRIYRAVNGVYLFVDEIPASQTEYVDSKNPDDLSEEMIVAGWSQPPTNLSGLTNLPNGIMAGFVGRDVYFCEPYYSHAWPESYVQSLDYPVVGLGRMDTTLVALTTGVPYFIQGTHPDSMIVVKSDIQQSCSSKRSIVSISGVVFYASPDGLVMLSSGGSAIVTDNMFTRTQWQALNPSSIHAYQHDSKYVAFYKAGTEAAPITGGFVYDLISRQFIFHDIYVTAGYNDLLRDQLFLASSDKSIKRWSDGANKTYTWRSKIFTLPQVMSFSCAQVEAETYPVTAKFYCDNSTTPFHTQTVTSRVPFRLPVKAGRDWEVQVEGTSQVFSIGIAQSMQELAGA